MLQQQAPGTNIDPTALQLSRAIRQHESGDNPNAKGASGEFGIGQWMPGNFESAARSFGLDPSDKSQANQEHVLYEQVKQQLDRGHTQSEVASWWNSGNYDPNVEGKGVNKFGVSYDVPSYVDAIKQQYVSQSNPQQGNQPSQGYAPPTPPGTQSPQTPQTSQASNAYTPPTPPTPSQNLSAVQDPHYVPSVDKATGKTTQAVNWANVPEWMPTKYLGEAGGAVLAKFLPPSLGGTAGTPASQNVQFPTAEQVGGSALKTGADVATLATLGGAAPATLAGNIALGAGVGAAQTAGGAMTQNASAKQVAQQGIIGGSIGGATAGLAYGLGKLLDSLGAKSISMAVRPNRKDFMDGYDAQFAVDNHLTGSAEEIAQKTDDFIKTKAQELSDKLGASDSSVDLADIYDKVQKQLTTGKGLLQQSGQNAAIQRALQQFQGEVLAANPTGALSIPDAQIVKQAWGSMGEWVNGTADPDAGALSTVYNKAYSALRQAIEDNSPEGVHEINAQIQSAIPILRAAIRRIPVQARSGVSLTDMLAILGAPMNPAGLAIQGAQHAMNSGLASSLFPQIAKGVSASTPAISGATAGLVSPMLSNKLQ